MGYTYTRDSDKWKRIIYLSYLLWCKIGDPMTDKLPQKIKYELPTKSFMKNFLSNDQIACEYAIKEMADNRDERELALAQRLKYIQLMTIQEGAKDTDKSLLSIYSKINKLIAELERKQEGK